MPRVSVFSLMEIIILIFWWPLQAECLECSFLTVSPSIHLKKKINSNHYPLRYHECLLQVKMPKIHNMLLKSINFSIGWRCANWKRCYQTPDFWQHSSLSTMLDSRLKVIFHIHFYCNLVIIQIFFSQRSNYL